MSIEARLTLLAALLIEGSISKEEVTELRNIPMTQFIPVADPDQEAVIIRKLVPRQSSSRYVPNSLMISKAFNSMIEIKFQKISKNGDISVTRNHHSQYPIDVFDAADRLLLDCNVSRREITTHLALTEIKSLTIEAVGDRSPAGKNTTYQITGLFDDQRIRNDDPTQSIELIMMDSKPTLRAPNGLTIEALYAVIIDQLEGLQSGPYHCVENQEALINTRIALNHLKSRTLARLTQGVKNTQKVHIPLQFDDEGHMLASPIERILFMVLKDEGAEYFRLTEFWRKISLATLRGEKQDSFVVDSLMNAYDECCIPRKLHLISSLILEKSLAAGTETDLNQIAIDIMTKE